MAFPDLEEELRSYLHFHPGSFSEIPAYFLAGAAGVCYVPGMSQMICPFPRASTPIGTQESPFCLTHQVPPFRSQGSTEDGRERLV